MERTFFLQLWSTAESCNNLLLCVGILCIGVGNARGNPPVSREERELAKLVRQFGDATTRALRKDERVKSSNHYFWQTVRNYELLSISPPK